MTKRYYWLKLPEGFFRKKPIKKLRKIAGGDTYTIIYLKMLLVAMKQDGKLFFDEVEDDFYSELALELDENTENVQVTVQFLLAQGMMELVDESEYSLRECAELTGSESSSAERMRRLRDKKASLSDTDVTKQLRPCDVEIEKEIDKDKDKEIDKNINLELETSKQKPVFISLPLVTGQGSFDIEFDYLNSMRELYPAVDIEQEFRNMKGWLENNPNNRKTKRGIKRFINGWLSRSQNKAPVNRGQAGNRNMTTGEYMESTKGWWQGD